MRRGPYRTRPPGAKAPVPWAHGATQLTSRTPTSASTRSSSGPSRTTSSSSVARGPATPCSMDAANEHELLLEVSRATGVRRVLTTHGHWDHIQAVEAVRDAGIDVGISREDASMLPAYDFTIPDDDVIEVGSLRLRTIHTPGHTPGSTCFLLEGKPVLFSGDTLFPGGAGEHDAPRRRLRRDHPLDRPPAVHPARRPARPARPRPRHHDRRRGAPSPGVGRPRLVTRSSSGSGRATTRPSSTARDPTSATTTAPRSSSCHPSRRRRR